MSESHPTRHKAWPLSPQSHSPTSIQEGRHSGHCCSASSRGSVDLGMKPIQRKRGSKGKLSPGDSISVNGVSTRIWTSWPLCLPLPHSIGVGFSDVWCHQEPRQPRVACQSHGIRVLPKSPSFLSGNPACVDHCLQGFSLTRLPVILLSLSTVKEEAKGRGAHCCRN